MINEHIKLQKRGNPLFPFSDSALHTKLNDLENNIVRDVQIGSIMQDKAILIQIYGDQKLNYDLIESLLAEK